MPRKLNPVTRFYEITTDRDYGRFWVTDDGCLACITSYGNYSHWWSAPGCEFRKFLLDCDKYYLAGKFSPNSEEFDGERTSRNIKDLILRLRRDLRLGRHEARREWDYVPSVFDSSEDFAHWQHRTKLEDAWELSCYCLPRSTMAFLERFWPKFTERLADELATEGRA